MDKGELIEAMARIIDPSSWRVMDGYLAQTLREDRGKKEDYPPETFKHKESMAIARALLPVIRAHLEPTSEMLANTVTSDGRMRIMEFITVEERGEAFMVPRYIWRAMLAASPIGEIG